MGAEPHQTPEAVEAVRARSLQGTRAGLVSRVLADGIDVVLVLLVEFGLLFAGALVRYLVTRHFRGPSVPPEGSVSLLGVISLIYLSIGWAWSGKTFGKHVMGLRVLGRGGRALSLVHAGLRALLYLVLPIGLLWAAASRSNASLQDLVTRTQVIYDWTPPIPEKLPEAPSAAA